MAPLYTVANEIEEKGKLFKSVLLHLANFCDTGLDNVELSGHCGTEEEFGEGRVLVSMIRIFFFCIYILRIYLYTLFHANQGGLQNRTEHL